MKNHTNDKGIIILSSLVAMGMVIASFLASSLQQMIIIPVTIVSIVFLILLIAQNPKIAHLTEKLEQIVFIITLLIIAISFALLYKPM
ncbi:MAG: hypothetical protein ACRCVG_07995 [Methanobacteriaceae archaeon]